jgi:hypothetical protein
MGLQMPYICIVHKTWLKSLQKHCQMVFSRFFILAENTRHTEKKCCILRLLFCVWFSVWSLYFIGYLWGLWFPPTYLREISRIAT